MLRLYNHKPLYTKRTDKISMPAEGGRLPVDADSDHHAYSVSDFLLC
ncbi:hypothetical protein [Coleofasciculus sp.]